MDLAVAPLREIEGLTLEVRALKNRTFGEVTTVAGLLAGRDFLTQIAPGEADLLLVAPATADLLAQAAHGLAGDLLTATLLTARCPVLMAPASVTII